MCTACFDLDQHIRRMPEAAYAILQALAPASPRPIPHLQSVRKALKDHPLPWRADGNILWDDADNTFGVFRDEATAAAVVDLVNILPDLQGK